jgi:AcrR family transcriptional regulator
VSVSEPKMTTDEPERRSPRSWAEVSGARATMPVASVYVPSFQRMRMVKALIETVSVHGYQDTSVTAIVATARASRRTFYEHFADRDDCLLAAFDAAVWELTDLAVKAYQLPGDWSERVRAALQAVLVFLEDEPTIASLVFVESPQAGPRVRARRAEVMKTLAAALDAGRPQPAQTVPALREPTAGESEVTPLIKRAVLRRPPNIPVLTISNRHGTQCHLCADQFGLAGRGASAASCPDLEGSGS